MFTIREKHCWHFGVYFAHTCAYVCSGACVCTHIHAFYFVLLSPPTLWMCEHFLHMLPGHDFFFKSCVASAERIGVREAINKGPGSLFWEDCELFWQFQVHFCLDQGKGCMTSGGHYVSKILLKTRNYCIFIPTFLLLPSSYVDFENFCYWTPRGFWGLVPCIWSLQSLGSGASANGLSLCYRVLLVHFSAQHQ